ncbi:MAG: hypothetical protein CFE33_12930 [Pseudorhodobacter sp. PARRP1]|nr:MAG: hypothetical protein CFE33_12930 [Pseudorhodobacter sp. PARRP1]
MFSDLNGTTEMLLAIDQPFTVLARTAQGVLIRFGSEDIRTPGGALRTWGFRPFAKPDRYCWHATGSPWLCCTIRPEIEFPLPLDGLIPRVEFQAFREL